MKTLNMSGMNKKLVKYMIIAIVVVIVLFLGIRIIKLFKGTALSFEKIESKMVDAAEKYYDENSHLLPGDEVSQSEISISTLVETGYIKELDSYLEKGVDCTGKVVLLKNGSHYTFVPKLNCGGDYTTNTLATKITSKANVVTKGDGLYENTNEYIFRGEKVNNYVQFAGKLWRILRVTKDNEIRLIQDDSFAQVDWDNRYNENDRTSSGFNKFEVSRIKDDLEALYNGTTFTAIDKAKIVPKPLCIGSRQEKDITRDGSTECSVLTEDSYALGLLQINEFIVASIDSGCTDLTKRQCSNYNYLSNYDNRFWTITPDKDSTSSVYHIDYLPESVKARSYAYIKLVINISGNVNYTKGNGTLEKPYIVK